MNKNYTVCPSIYFLLLKDKQKYFIFIDFPRMFLLMASSLLLKLIWILFQYMSIHKDEKCKTILLEILILNLKLLRINCLFKKKPEGKLWTRVFCVNKRCWGTPFSLQFLWGDIVPSSIIHVSEPQLQK